MNYVANSLNDNFTCSNAIKHYKTNEFKTILIINETIPIFCIAFYVATSTHQWVKTKAAINSTPWFDTKITAASTATAAVAMPRLLAGLTENPNIFQV